MKKKYIKGDYALYLDDEVILLNGETTNIFNDDRITHYNGKSLTNKIKNKDVLYVAYPIKHLKKISKEQAMVELL